MQLTAVKKFYFASRSGAYSGDGDVEYFNSPFQDSVPPNPFSLQYYHPVVNLITAGLFFVCALACFPTPARADNAADAARLFGEAWHLAQNGDNQGAIVKYEAGLRLRSESAPAHFYLGKSLEAVGRLAEALAQYREAVRLAPQSNEGKQASERIVAVRAAIPITPPLPLVTKDTDGWLRTTGGCYVWSTRSLLLPHITAAIWTGGCIDGRASGPGTFTLRLDGNDSEHYHGEMLGGKREGQGRWERLYLDDGVWSAYYEGQFRNNDYDGYGIYEEKPYFSNEFLGLRFEGNFAHGKPKGKGEQIIGGVTHRSGIWVDGVLDRCEYGKEGVYIWEFSKISPC